jgi:hypothetical protein
MFCLFLQVLSESAANLRRLTAAGAAGSGGQATTAGRGTTRGADGANRGGGGSRQSAAGSRGRNDSDDTVGTGNWYQPVVRQSYVCTAAVYALKFTPKVPMLQ